MSRKRKAPKAANVVIVEKAVEPSSGSLLLPPPVPRRGLELRLQHGASLPNIEVPSENTPSRDTNAPREPVVPATPSVIINDIPADPAITGSFAAFCERGEQLEREHLDGWSEAPPEPKEPLLQAPPARRAAMRWLAGTVLVAAVTLLVSGGVKAAGRYRTRQPLAAPGRETAALVAAPKQMQAAAPAPQPAPPAPPATASAAPEPAQPEPVASAPPAPPPIEAAAARREAERLLNMGRVKAAIPAAEAAIEADPDHAMGYLLLGSALQSAGRWKDGIAAYSRCVHRATKGLVAECRAVGGH